VLSFCVAGSLQTYVGSSDSGLSLATAQSTPTLPWSHCSDGSGAQPPLPPPLLLPELLLPLLLPLLVLLFGGVELTVHPTASAPAVTTAAAAHTTPSAYPREAFIASSSKPGRRFAVCPRAALHLRLFMGSCRELGKRYLCLIHG
jgi:hypothetical protein